MLRLRSETTYEYQVFFQPSFADFGGFLPCFTKKAAFAACACAPCAAWTCTKSRVQSFTTGQLPASLTTLRLAMTGRFSPAAGVIVLCVNGVDVPTTFFQGYIAVDQDGIIVWYYESPQGQTPVAGDFFQLRDGNFLITIGQSLGIPVSEAQINQAAQMLIINALGQKIMTQPLVCQTNPQLIGTKGAVIANFGLTHAAWQDPENPHLIFNGGLQLRDPFYDAGLTPPGVRMQLAETIRRWDLRTNRQEILTSAFALEDVFTFRGVDSDQPVGPPLNCTGMSPGLQNQDWQHFNAIARLSCSRPWVVSQRNTSSVMFLNPRNFTLLFRFGSVPPSDLKFATPDDMFYNQHDAHEVSSQHVLMFDDGTQRLPSQGGPYARAIEYCLDLEHRLITKFWEFRPEVDIQCKDGGSSRRLKNGNTIVDFGASNLVVKHVFEANSEQKAKAVAHLTVQSTDSSDEWLLYRAVPISCLFGETQIF